MQGFCISFYFGETHTPLIMHNCLISHLPHWFLDIFHVRSLHTVAACAPRHPSSTAVWRVPEQFGFQHSIFLSFLKIAKLLTNLLKYMSELIDALPWNLLKFASLVSWTSQSFNPKWQNKVIAIWLDEEKSPKFIATWSGPPKYMSLLMLLAFPNFFTASSPTGLGLLTADGVRLGLREGNVKAARLREWDGCWGGSAKIDFGDPP